jgi:porin
VQTKRGFCRLTIVLAMSLAWLASPLPAARAQDATDMVPGAPSPSLSSSLPEPLRSFGGLRPFLAEHGVTFQINHTGDAFAHVSGGLDQGLSYAGRLETIIEADLGKIVGWQDATFHIGSYWIHGNGPSRHFVGNLLAVSDLEAIATVRLDEMWIEQKFLDGRAGLRVGQLVSDTEFYTSASLNLIIGSTFGWPGIFATNLPSGGPAFPFATPGVRIKYEPTDNVALLASVFDGDPAGPGLNDPQFRDLHGVNFRLRDPPFAIAEMQIKYGRDSMGQGLGGTIKLGGWHHFGRFADLRYGIDGLPLAAPVSIGLPIQHRGNSGIYGLIDQQIFRKSADDSGPGLYATARVSFSPSDRNLIDAYLDGALNFQSMIDARPDDSFGFAGAFAKISSSARGADLDMNFFNSTFAPVRDHEALLEATYSFQVAPGFSVQPNAQYVFHPGGHVVDPTDPLGLRALHNALAVGIRTTIRY